MWLEIPWIRTWGEQADGELGRVMVKPSLRKDAILSVAVRQVGYLPWCVSVGSYEQRCCPTEHSWKNTPIWVWLSNVAVCEIWVISSKLRKRPGSTMYMVQPLSRLLAAMYWCGLWVNLVRTKLVIQGFSPLFKLWMSVAWSSKREFNLTVLAERLVYKQ